MKPTDRHIRTRWPASSSSMTPQPHFLTICWDGITLDGTRARYQANLCKHHRQVIALECSTAQGVLRQFGESCDLCQGREPRVVDLDPDDQRGGPQEKP